MTANVRPKQVEYACYLLCGGLILGFALQVICDGSFESVTINPLSNRYAWGLAMYAYLLAGIWKGRNSARIIVFSLFLIGLFIFPPRISEISEAPITGAIELAQIAVKVLAFVWLFTNPGKAWFIARKVTPAQNDGTPINSSQDLLKAIEAKKQM